VLPVTVVAVKVTGVWAFLLFFLAPLAGHSEDNLVLYPCFEL